MFLHVILPAAQNNAASILTFFEENIYERSYPPHC